MCERVRGRESNNSSMSITNFLLLLAVAVDVVAAIAGCRHYLCPVQLLLLLVLLFLLQCLL